jgi:short-subunit dehydrogenase
MKGKVVIITGASSGIGRALALEFAGHGARLSLAARSSGQLESLKKEILEMHTEVLTVVTDVTLEEDARALVQKTMDAYGRIDVLINNAGISMRALFRDVDLDVMKRLMDVNFWGAVYCTKYALPHLLESKGTVAGVSSIAGYRGLPGRAGYSASKFALQGFLEVLRTENLKTGLHVLTACPGFTASSIREKALVQDGSEQGTSPREEGKMMSAEEVAVWIYKAIEKRKRTLILTTQGKITVLLNKLFPSLMDRMVYNHMAKEPDSPFK